MRLERVRVEEGFLDGLDLVFAPGLNVVIGARGVGKTSLVELIRYGLRLPHLDDRRANFGRNHAEAVLSGGRVSITFQEGEQRRTVSRSASDPDTAIDPLEGSSTPPEVLGQNELEGIGLDPRSRMRLIDARASIILDAEDPRLRDLRTEAMSITSQLRSLGQQRESYRQEELMRPSLVDELEDARAREAELLSRVSGEVAELRQALADGTSTLGALRTRREALVALRRELAEVSSDAVVVGNRMKHLVTEYGDSVGDPSLLSGLVGLLESQTTTVSSLSTFVTDVDDNVALLSSRIATVDDELRPLRLEFEQLQSGSGEAAQRTALLERQLAEVDARLRRLPSLEMQSRELRDRRNGIMLALDQIAEAVWGARSEAVDSLNGEFLPRIRVTAEHFGDRREYANRLSDALRGSGLQHNQLAEWLADRVTPQELIAAVENSDAALLATVGEITPNRVERLMAHLNNSEKLGEVLTARVEDSVVFEMLVGTKYQSSERLSTGQRCALVLPLLLAESGRTLILDQPEDHLDNAYLVENTIRSILVRSATAQTIVVTHNANIPVLGNADRVIALQSDGKRGYVAHDGELNDPLIVETITRLMEGGSRAFARRAAFYGESDDI